MRHLTQVLLQAPGVAQDSFGQIHLRGEHANVQYRLNGVEPPEQLSVSGQAIEFGAPITMATSPGRAPWARSYSHSHKNRLPSGQAPP